MLRLLTVHVELKQLTNLTLGVQTGFTRLVLSHFV